MRKQTLSDAQAETLLDSFCAKQSLTPKDDFCDKTMLAIFEDEEAGEKLDAYIDEELKRFKVHTRQAFTAKTLSKISKNPKRMVMFFAKFGTIAAAACAAFIFSISPKEPAAAEEQEDYMSQLENMESDLSAMATLIAMEEFFDGKNM